MDLSTLGISVLTVTLFCFWVYLNRRALRNDARSDELESRSFRFEIGLLFWLAATAVYATSGIVQTDARLMMLAVVPAFGGAAVLSVSKLGRRIATATPWAVLIGFLAFRLPLELILNQLYAEGRLPVQMTFHGLNYDIVIGSTALPLSIWVATRKAPPRLMLIAWNTFGMGLLSIVGAVAILSMPTPFRQFTNDPSSILLSTFPFIWIPTFLAASALAGHVLVYRKLLIEACNRNKKTDSPSVYSTTNFNEQEILHV